MDKFVSLSVGDPAPTFTGRSNVNPAFKFDTVAGRYVLLAFCGTISDSTSQSVIDFVKARPSDFDDEKLAFFGVIVGAGKDAEAAANAAKLRFFFDDDGNISRSFGSLPVEKAATTTVPFIRKWILLDPMLRVMAVVPMQAEGAEHKELNELVKNLAPLERFAGFEIQAPVLILPNVFERELCQKLIGLYESHGGEESGFMREVAGKTVAAQDYKHKRRADYTVSDPELISLLQSRIRRRIVPEIQKAHQFKITRMERYIVGCYDAGDGGHFRAHRDNTTRGTAHRRFAVSINLNDDFDGGTISFPEFSPRGFKMPPGGACVFSCSLMHAVSQVTRGRRYAFLPFLYDDEAAKIREANNAFLGEGVGSYHH